MTQRYFAPQLPPAGGLIALSDAEARHASRVMRVQPGDTLTLFDGCGREAAAVVAQVNRHECHCQAQPPEAVDREPRCRLQLGVALPKGDRARELVERLTELGVSRLTPLETARMQRGYSGSRLSKLRRTVVEASKQCGRNVLMTIDEPTEVEQFMGRHQDESASCWIAHPSEPACGLSALASAAQITATIGPEGGWDERELQAAESHGFRRLHLGPRIYRIETAAVALAASAVAR